MSPSITAGHCGGVLCQAAAEGVQTWPIRVLACVSDSAYLESESEVTPAGIDLRTEK